MKSKVDERELAECLLGTLRGILEDARAAYPKHRKGFDRDFDRISTLVKVRGPSLFLLDLPHLDDLLTAGLRSGVYTPDGAPLTRRVRRGSTIPRLFQELYLLVFDLNGRLKADPDVNALAFLRELFCFAKKVELPCNDTKVYETVATFFRIEEQLPEPDSPIWEDPDDSSSSYDLASYDNLSVLQNDLEHNWGRLREQGGHGLYAAKGLLESIQGAFNHIFSTLGSFSPSDHCFKHGPGCVSDRPSGGNKYKFPSWSPKLECVFPASEFAFVNYSDWIERNGDIDYAKSESSRMIAVPKTFKGPRLIASEPTSHQWCQQAVKSFIAQKSESTWISGFVRFNDQSRNQELAVKASRDGSLATIDLSEASDRVTCRLVERACRANMPLLRALSSCRTSYLTQNLDKKSPSHIKLKKFSTMGSACTFPVETLLFLGIVLGSVHFVHHHGYKPVYNKNYEGSIAVFGDDIVAPTDCLDVIRAALTFLSFKVNDRKTFGSGYFRESCGVDAFKGFNITPIRIRAAGIPKAPESVLSVIETVNNLFKAGYWHASARLKTTISEKLMLPITRVGSGVIGFESFSGPSVAKTRWNRHLHQVEARIVVFKATVRKTPINDMTALLQWFTERPLPDTPWQSGIGCRPRLKFRPGWVPTSLL